MKTSTSLQKNGDGMAYPGVVIDGDMAVHVTYADTVNGVTNILFTSIYDGGNTWTDPTIVNEPGIASQPPWPVVQCCK